MSSAEEKKNSVAARAKQLHVQFDDYAQSVTLVSSVEGWIRHSWGPSGEIAPTLEAFERFVQWGEHRPDFVARFRTGYRLCGEVVRTFRGPEASPKDLDQVIAYTHHLKQTAKSATCGDVLLLVHPYTDGIAAQALAEAAASELDDHRPQVPVVIVSYLTDRRATGEWYDLMWRDQPGNSRFSEPNVSGPGEGGGLNELIADAPHMAIRLNAEALNVFTGNPLINDDPPPFYAAVVVIFPAINELLTEDERDDLATTGRVRKILSRDTLLATSCVSAFSPPARYLQAGLDFMVEHGWARRVADTNPQEYEIQLDLRKLQRKDPLKLLVESTARQYVNRVLEQRAKTRKRAAKAQLRLL